MKSYQLIRLKNYSYDIVQYYTVKCSFSEVDEFSDFRQRFEAKSIKTKAVDYDLSHLMDWIYLVGVKYSAYTWRFHEKEGVRYIRIESSGQSNSFLCLFSYVFSENVVVLINGGYVNGSNWDDKASIRKNLELSGEITNYLDKRKKESSLRIINRNQLVNSLGMTYDSI